ncbi:MAG TPA: SUMF1/EgtB/PvdO family nonheme iron enzyme [Nitrospiria bacterium]|nr:SUMF1/EgtB/PvdO family nonheme iron enzyme [Nitrospiria bacterium]
MSVSKQAIILLATIVLFGAFSGNWAGEDGKPLKMILVKGGCYEMGNGFDDDLLEGKPVHQVCLNDFYLGESEVTQGEWKEIMGTDATARFRGAEYPVEEATLDDVQAFLLKLNGLSGKKYRLPTEAEWEYAAREGGKKIRWAGTDQEGELQRYAWYKDNSKDETHRVKSRLPNQFGFYDMSGNVWEWVSDHYDDSYYSQSPKNNPQGPEGGKYYVLRGGAWNSRERFVRADFRMKETHDKRYNYFVGFRLARDAKIKEN